jgi:membrane protease YdiL (CAAX protease family)
MDPQSTALTSTTVPARPGIASTMLFFLAVFVATWIVWIPRALESRGLFGGDWATSVGRGWTYAPALTAVVFLALTGGRQSLASLRRRLLLWRIGWRWYVAITAVPLAVAISVATIHALTGGQFSEALPLALDLPLPIIPLIIGIRLMTDGIGEETAWRGVALPRLLNRLNPLTASVLLGILWALWHLPLIFTDGSTMANNSIPLLFVLLPAEAVVYTWIYQHTRGSVFAAALFHAMIGLWAVASPAAEANGRLQLIRVIIWCGLAGALLLKYGPTLKDERTDAPAEQVHQAVAA